MQFGMQGAQVKKVLQYYDPARGRAANKRFARSIRNSQSGSLRTKHRRAFRKNDDDTLPVVDAPAKLDIYSPKNHSAFVSFLKRLRHCINISDKTIINLRNCKRITAAAGLLLVAELDRLKKAYPEKIVKCINPENPRNGPRSDENNFVESALNQIGFYRLIGQANNTKASAKSVKKWRQLSGETADGTLANSLLQTLAGVVPPQALKRFYRGAIEAIANCVEHAYPSMRQDGLGITDPRWWMLVGVDEQQLTIIVCDLGVGIPNTLPAKHGNTILDQIKRSLSITGNSDSELIRISTHIKQTRTKLSNRGKGGKDFRSMPLTFPSSYLAIRSNKGSLFITGKDHPPFKKTHSRIYVPGTNRAESMIENSGSICGTLIEWAIHFKDLQR